MTPSGMSLLSVIPARAGSKGIPNKNLQEITGLSLVGRAVLLSIEVDWIDDTVLSTDSELIASEGLKYGALVPFLRPPELATDYANSKLVWKHAFEEVEKKFDRKFDLSVLLEPTSPMRQKADIENSIKLLESGRFDCVVTVSRTPSSYTPEKTLVVGDGGKLRPYVKGRTDSTIRQTLPPYYHRNGVCYVATRDHLLSNFPIISGNCGALVCKDYIVNIDDPMDLAIATIMMQNKNVR